MTSKPLQHISILYNVLLKEFTYTKTGGPAEILALPKSKCEIIDLVLYCKEHYIPWLVIGDGSNLIISDSGIHGMVIVIKDMNEIRVCQNEIVVDAGAKLIDASHKALSCSLTGLEFACGIPGTVGGAVYMNAGAYEGEIKDVLTSVEALFPDGTIRTLTNQELRLSYRHSAVQEMNCIVLLAKLSLKKGNREIIKKKMEELTKLREASQPLEYPSCGSVFKRPPGYFVGKIIQDSNLQGLKWGGAQISEKHAGFIVNVDNATATDYIELIKYIQKVIKMKFGIDLETEVRILGEKGKDFS